jgi:dGTPase
MSDRWSELLNPLTFRKRSDRASFDGRNPFEGDYGRLISSSPIRRLQDKTQVFPLEQSDFIRTRLTHSLEVSYIGSSIGNSIEKYLIENNYLNKETHVGHLSSLLRVSGLVHDIGNPPFGHFGEEAIKQFFREYFNNNIETCKKLSQLERSDFENFDGNVQAFRILKKLHFFGDEHSFNLTYPTLATVIKYPSNSINGNKGKGADTIGNKKFGYFASEVNEYDEINKTLSLNNKRHPAVYLIEAADDIAYCAADIEDGVKLGIVGFQEIKKVFSDNLKQNSDLNEYLDKTYIELASDESDRLSIAIQKFRVAAQARMIGEIINSFKENYDIIMKGDLHDEIIDISKASDIRKSFKKLQYTVFDNKKIMQTELAGWEIIYGLLSIFIPAILSDKCDRNSNNYENRLYKNISSSLRYTFQEYASKNYSNDYYNKIQLVVDFISGMTDSYALSLYQKLKGIRL